MAILNLSNNIHFNLYALAAKKLGIEITQPIKTFPYGIFKTKKKELAIRGALPNLNFVVPYSISKNKFITAKLLRKNQVPAPKGIQIKKDQKIDFEKITRKISKPLVVKPIKGFGGKGVSVNIQTEEAFDRAVKEARKHFRKILVEEFIPGNNYRILIYDNKVIDILERIPAYIKGDGNNTIEELINKKNKIRKKNSLPKIKIDFELENYLKKQKLSMAHIPQKKETIQLRQNSNLSTGGETKRIEKDKVHIDNVEIFKKASKTIKMRFAGIDFISADITKSWKSSKCAVNELNKAPGLRLHYIADMKKDNFVAETILKMYFNIK